MDLTLKEVRDWLKEKGDIEEVKGFLAELNPKQEKIGRASCRERV